MKTSDNRDQALQLANVSRRSFLKGIAASGALVLAVSWDPATAESEPRKYGADYMAHGWVDNPNIFIRVARDGQVTIINHRGEMGQGIRTSLVMVMADEMGADWQQVHVEQAIANEEKYGNQDTDGSRSMRHWFEPLRRAGAAARTMLEQAAANQWQVPVSECRTDVHAVVHTPSQRTLSFGSLAAAAAELPVPARQSLTLKTPDQWRYIMRTSNQPLAIDGMDINQGKALYAADMRVDNMLYAVIARPPSYGSRVKNVDASKALAIAGVVKVLELPSVTQPSGFEPLGGVAVLAEHTWAAIQGRNALRIEWDDSPAGDNAHYDSEAFRASLESKATQPGKPVRQVGDFSQAQRDSAQHLTATYYAPHLAQAPMEPMAALVSIQGDHAEVWSSVQNPQATRDGVAKRLGLKASNVTVNCALMGGAFGRKAKPDFVFEAADLSKAMGGRPVRVQWTREDDLHHSFYHTVALQHMEGTLDHNGQVSGWLHRILAPSISSQFAPDSGHLSDRELTQGIRNMPFDIPAIQQETGEALGHVRIGWFRSVYNIPHAFAIQSFVAELANAAGQDHKAFLLELLGPDRQIDPRTQGENWNYSEDPSRYPIDIKRYKNVIERVTQEADWGKTMPPNRGLGLAVHHSFVSYCAIVMDVEVTPTGDVIVHQADIAFDCGPQINPDRVRAQMEGACVMGIGIALMTEITAKNGRVQQDNFHQYLIPRINQVPRTIRVHAVNSDLDVPLGGAGEPGLPPVAPALCNAIFAASGKRIRSLPVADQLKS
ncbi:xanthine dehydrogenase family protein molybdopterin-binding subunit [Aestuariicella hydrocarbonica]|uniref:Xanthine dehydrogenase family protein molybdopterin-binding subunit n=1 Tax=Pseudomaricurvus hydrocarbonicus TaxID=1470433 RepID=A0A9E5JS13_9GAMM|nr:molybdopterin cofactor-binding domain-containing protein [Aestuariicella hydrocarbonica]NHO65757.1 xanthine dehydrogenase family protein molybdopterin-binding subunit [Aestuariicella hydrocarbonica]